MNDDIADIPRVALLLETSRGYGRGILRGIAEYARLHGPWEIYVTPGDFLQSVPEMSLWGGTGIICRIETPKIAEAILKTKLPVVALDVSQNAPIEILEQAHFCEVVSDSQGAAKMAAEHLLDFGLENFAYVGEYGRQWSEIRRKSFQDCIRQKGFEPLIYKAPLSKRDQSWAREMLSLSAWIKDLPKPIGIMACNDNRGRQVLEACSSANVIVPIDALVIGIDNDKLLCELSSPPLSSVALNAKGGGYRAASLLDRMMKGERCGQERIVVEPVDVIVRQSTNAPLLIEDPEVATALHFIKTYSSENISINDVVEQIDISRRNLELRFKKAIGRSPRQELLRIRLLHARELLLKTNSSISGVAFNAGFCSPAHLSQTFKKKYGKTPIQYRRDHKLH